MLLPDGPILEVSGLTKRFGGLTAVDNVTFQVKAGGVTGIMGPNGAGKTTLFALISGELFPSAGRVMLNGQDITGLTPHVVCRRGLSRTFQLTSVFPEMTVLESVWVGVNSRTRRPWNFWARSDHLKETRIEAERICRLMGLEDRAHDLSVNLPYGDQKILEMAMALSTKPSVLLLDEPTQGVGPKESEDITKVIERLAKEMTIILIEHTMDILLNVSDKIMVLSNGRLLCEDTPEKVCLNADVQRIYLGELT